MNINQYSNHDLNMYLSDTYTILNGKPTYIYGLDFYDSDGDLLDSDGSSEYNDTVLIRGRQYDNDDFTYSFDYNSVQHFKPITLGYYNVDDYAVFFYRKQGNNYKKLPTNNLIEYFVPQNMEFHHLDKSIYFEKPYVLLKPCIYYSLEEAYEKLINKELFSAALHKNYAIVKKGKYRNPVIYYMLEPVIEYDGTNFIPITSESHITKFKLEMGL